VLPKPSGLASALTPISVLAWYVRLLLSLVVVTAFSVDDAGSCSTRERSGAVKWPSRECENIIGSVPSRGEPEVPGSSRSAGVIELDAMLKPAALNSAAVGVGR
jgi:hypothetical protein